MVIQKAYNPVPFVGVVLSWENNKLKDHEKSRLICQEKLSHMWKATSKFDILNI